MLYVYGIVDPREIAPLAEFGHDGAEVFAVPCEGMAAAVSVLAGSAIPPTAGNLWRHECVLEALMDGHTVLPHRFGTVAPDRRMLVAGLRGARAQLDADFVRVRGKVELALRMVAAIPSGDGEQNGRPAPSGIPRPSTNAVASDRPATPPGLRGVPRPGRHFLQARMAAERRARAWRGRAEEIERFLRSVLDPLSDDVRWRLPEEDAEPLKASFLVPRGLVAVFVETVRTVRATVPEVEISCTGPWPPYSFIATQPALEQVQ